MSCWKKIMSLWPIQKSMLCPYCNNLEWRLDKTIEEYNKMGCMKCRILLNNKNENDSLKLYVRKKVYNYKVTGRYE